MSSQSHNSAQPAPNAMEERRTLMLGGPIFPTLLKLTFPVITVVVTQTFVAVLEAYWVSRLGTEAVAGVSLVLPLLILMNTMSNGGIGGECRPPSHVQSAQTPGRRRRTATAHRRNRAELRHNICFRRAASGPAAVSALGGHGATLQFALDVLCVGVWVALHSSGQSICSLRRCAARAM